MRIRITSLIVLITILLNIIPVSAIEIDSVDKALELANKSLIERYGINPDIFQFPKQTEVNGVMEKINPYLATGQWAKGNLNKGDFSEDMGFILAYGKPFDFDSVTGRHRYLGYTVYGDEFTNILFREDGHNEWFFEEEDWIDMPWKYPKTKGIKTTVRNDFDNPEYQSKINENIKLGILSCYPTRVKDYNKFNSIDFTRYVHILQPPTEYAWGMGRLWHWINGTVWYITVGIAPFNMVENQPILVSITENEDGTTTSVTFENAVVLGNEVQLTVPKGMRLVEWKISNEKTNPFDETITWDGNVAGLPSISSGDETNKPIVNLNDVNIIYVRYRVNSNNVNITGDLVLTEKRITKAYSLSDIGTLSKFNFTYNSAGSHKHTDKDGDTYWVKRSNPVDTSYKYVIERSNALNNLAIATVGDFIPKYNGTNIKTGTASWSGGSSRLTPNMFYVVWRGKDIPTIASYKEGNNHPLTALGLKIGKTPQTTRNSLGGYQDKIDISLDKSNNNSADYTTTFSCSKDGNTNTQTHSTSDSATYSATLGVKSFIGSKNTANAVPSISPTSFSAGGITFNRARGYAIHQNNLIKFYPYVQMAYDLPATNADGSGVTTRAVNVLAAHESSIKPVDYLEIGWYNPRPNMSLTMNSTQWNTHARSVSRWGKNSTLPGGAIYTLDTKANVTKVGVTTWQHYIPNNQLPNVTDGASHYTLANTGIRNNDLINQIKASLDTLDVVQFVEDNPNSTTAFNGVKIEMRGGQQVYGNLTSPHEKYLLKRGTSANSHKANEADIDIIAESTSRTYYKVNADVNGNVIISKSTNGTNWAVLQTLSKTQGAANITNAEAKALDDRTKLVTNFILALDRNMGNDPSVGNGPQWYNEAWDGLCVVKTDTVLDIGFKAPPTRSVALDVKLCPPKASTSDVFTKYYVSQFRLNEKSYIRTGHPDGFVARFNGIDIIIPEMHNMYVSRKFYIPNATAMDLY